MSFAVRGLNVHDADGQALLHDVCLAAGTGEALVVIGETGSGKSLIAQAMLGLLPNGFRVAGTLCLAGRTVDLSQRAAVRRLWSRDTLLLPQEPRAALDPTMRIGGQLAEAGGGIAAALAAVDLAPDVARAWPFALSGGMAQRALVAAALCNAAPLVVVDEPTKGLDTARVGDIVMRLRALLDGGRSLLVITHDSVLARGLGGSVAVLRQGRILECRPATALFTNPGHAYTGRWLAADPAIWPARAAPAPAEIVLAGEGLTVHRGRGVLFRDLDIAVRRGATVGVAGPSGAGKTTLGNVLVGLLPPLAGRVLWQGEEPYRDRAVRRRLRRRFQKLHQDPAAAFLPQRPLGRQLQDLAEVVPGLDLAASLPALLDRLGLGHGLLERYPAEVSSGEAQRLAIIRLLLLDPVAVIADEPTSRLDPIMQRETMALLRDTLQRDGIGLVLISHNEALLAAFADEVVELGRCHRGPTVSGNHGSLP